MSKPSTATDPAALAVWATPTTPPAGPETTASRPRKASARTRPPAEVSEIERRAVDRLGDRSGVGPDGGGQIGVGDGGLRAGDVAGQGRDLVRQGDEIEPRGLGQSPGLKLMFGIEVGVQEGDGG